MFYLNFNLKYNMVNAQEPTKKFADIIAISCLLKA